MMFYFCAFSRPGDDFQALQEIRYLACEESTRRDVADEEGGGPDETVAQGWSKIEEPPKEKRKANLQILQYSSAS